MSPLTTQKGVKEKENSSLEKELAYQKELNRITNKVHSAYDTNEILLKLQDEILNFFDAERITVYIVDGNEKHIVSRIMTGNEISEIRVPINKESIAGYCACSGRVLDIRDAYSSEELRNTSPSLRFDRSWDEKTGFRTTQVLAAPITYNKYLLGVIQLINKRSGDCFTEEDKASVMDIAQVLGVAFFKNNRAASRSTPTRFDYLVTNNILGNSELLEAMGLARETGKPVETILMEEYQVPKDAIAKSLSNFYNARFVHFDDRMVIPGELIRGLRPNYLRTNVFVPIGKTETGRVAVAMQDPSYLPARDAIARILPGKEFEYCVSLKEDINQIIDMFFDVKKEEEATDSGSIEEILGQLDGGEEEFDEDLEGVTEENSAIVQLINKVIVDAYNRGASDIHIEPRHGKANAQVRLRIDGVCQVYQTIPYTYKRAIVSRAKIMADLDISERRLPQDGKIKFRKYAPLDIELRVATIPTTGQNEDVVMRILSAGEPIPLENMGMTERDYNTFLDIINKPYGIVLVVGPTGSGKTTTLHAALRHINTPETKIWTAEDPVEITQDGLRQVQVQPKIGLGFANAMRSFLRADPDVIMVGEMRDHETLSTGIEASLTGHLVFSTLHTNSAPETVTRLLDMGMDPFNFADALLGVLAQRLARTLCRNCKEEYHPTREEYDSLARAYGQGFEDLGYEYNKDFVLYRAKGCPECGNTGYRGRTALHELLAGTDKIKVLIQNRERMESLKRQAQRDGMTTLMQDGIRKVLLGYTDLVQVRKVCIR